MAESYKDSLRIDNNNQGVDSTLRTVVSGDGDTTGLQLEDGTTGNINVLGGITAATSLTTTAGHVTAGYGIVAGVETVDAGNGSGNATALSLNTLTSFVNTATSKSHVSLADGSGSIKNHFSQGACKCSFSCCNPCKFCSRRNTNIRRCFKRSNVDI